MRHQIILFIEPAKEEFICSESIGNLYLNRFAIDEDAAHEVLGIHYLKQWSYEMCDPENDAYPYNKSKRKKKERSDKRIIEKAIKDAAKIGDSCNQLHIFRAGQGSGWFHKGSERMDHISDVICKHKISSIIFNQLSLIRIRVIALDDVQSAYRDDQGIVLYRPPNHSKMTEEEFTLASFQTDIKFLFLSRLQNGIE